MEVVVTGIGLVSALGKLETSFERLLAGESGIRKHQPFPDLPSRPLALIGDTITSLETLTNLVVAEAIQDANLSLPLSDCGVVIGSSRACQASWEQLAQKKLLTKEPEYAYLESWLDTLPNRGAIATAQTIGSKGPVLAPMAACATGIWAIAQGYFLVESGQCERVIAGAVEAPITPLTLAGFDKMGALANTGSYPFDRNREGLVLGEGGAVLVLESAELAKKRLGKSVACRRLAHATRSVKIYGQVLGFGLTCDASHVTSPEPGGKSAIAAVKQCLERSQLDPSDINYIHAHGTGTQLNDQNEARLIQSLFGKSVAVSSTKGATGHTLGASGALGAAFSLMALKYQMLPPSVGLREPEFELDLVRKSRRDEVQRVLCFSFGFGGQNAVMALGREGDS